jgi:hypothetical protein
MARTQAEMIPTVTNSIRNLKYRNEFPLAITPAADLSLIQQALFCLRKALPSVQVWKLGKSGETPNRSYR